MSLISSGTVKRFVMAVCGYQQFVLERICGWMTRIDELKTVNRNERVEEYNIKQHTRKQAERIQNEYKTGPLQLVLHNFTNSQHSLNIFGKERPYSVFRWLL